MNGSTSFFSFLRKKKNLFNLSKAQSQRNRYFLTNMNHTELTAKTTITDIEIKQDKNQNPYFRLSLRGFPNCFYAFSYNLSAETLTMLKENPEVHEAYFG